MVKVWDAEVSTPPLAVPPLSFRVTVMVAEPLASGAGVKVRVPPAVMAGCALKRAVLLALTVKVRVWLDSFAGPALMFVAQLETV